MFASPAFAQATGSGGFGSTFGSLVPLLLIFLIPTTIIFHLVPFQFLPIARNLSLVGGLLIAIDRSSVDLLKNDSSLKSNEIEYSDLNEDN